MAIQLVSSREAATLHGCKCLVYGKAGVGKTYLARTAPKPVIISAESGLLSLRDVDLPVIGIRSVADLNEAYTWATESAEAAQFQTIYIDSISEVAEVVLAAEKALTKDPRQAYGALIDQMLHLIKAFRDISGKHVVMSAKQGSTTDSVTGVTTYAPSMPGSRLGAEVPYLFDEVLRLQIGKTQEGVEYRYFQTRPDLQSEAKDRSGALDAMERPDLTFLFNKIITSSTTKE